MRIIAGLEKVLEEALRSTDFFDVYDSEDEEEERRRENVLDDADATATSRHGGLSSFCCSGCLSLSACFSACLLTCLPACLLFSITFSLSLSLSLSLSPFSLSPDRALDEVAMKYGNACNGILRSVACAYQEVILKRSCITGERIERPSTSAT